jgi:aminoglycoside phosphotransferase (APT) family kinase protein
MKNNKQSYPKTEKVYTWLTRKHKAEIKNLVSLSGGFWSSAYAYRVGKQDFVLRLSDMADGFAIDKAAMRFKSPKLPVPNVVDIGVALGFNYAISERHYGRFIETTSANEGSAVGNTLKTLLAGLRSVDTSEDDAVVWFNPEKSPETTWHSWLTAGLMDNPDTHVSGWRVKLAENPVIDNLFKTCEGRIHELLPVCPERRDLIHGDLLHQNVLVSNDASKVTAIFSWKCSAYGDFLYDVAWCTFWKDWYPGIAASDIWNRTLAAQDLSEADLVDASLRHHCYELQIGASHLGWNTWTGNQNALEAVAHVLERKLANGPLPMNNT